MKRKGMTKESNVLVGALIGIAACITIMLIMGAVGAWMINSERLDLTNMNWLKIVIQVLSAFVGTLIALTLVKEKLAIITGMIVAGVLVILICIAMLFFDGISGNILTGVISISSGSAAACLLKLKTGEGSMKKKRKAFR